MDKVTQLIKNYKHFLDYSFLGNTLDIWIMALVAFTLMMILRRKIAHVLLTLLDKIDESNEVIHTFKEVIKGPLQLALAILAYYIATLILTSNIELEGILTKLTRTAIIFISIWIIIRIVGLYSILLRKKLDSSGNELGEAIVKMVVTITKILLLLLGVVVVVDTWGFNGMAILASFSVLSIGISLSSQDTVKHFWGSIVLFADKPFDIGDWITVGNVDGTVEEIGIRSTQVRTFEKALITVPNGKLADSNILNWSKRPKRRIKMMLGVDYNTTPDKMQDILNDIRTYLKNNKDINQEQILVYFSDFGDSSLNILVYCFSKDPNWEPWLKAKEALYLELMRIVKRNGSTIAFPTQSLYIESLPNEMKS